VVYKSVVRKAVVVVKLALGQVNACPKERQGLLKELRLLVFKDLYKEFELSKPFLKGAIGAIFSLSLRAHGSLLKGLKQFFKFNHLALVL
jgi:hypothetical protein